MTSYDAVVIGSGMSGLTAANLLARSGMKVLLTEQHYRYGGYLQNFMVQRTPFDSGCHYVGALGPGQVFDRYLRYLGVRDQIQTVALDESGFDDLVFPDGSFSIPVGLDRLKDKLQSGFIDEAAGIERFIAEIKQELVHFPMYTLAEVDNPRGRSPHPERTLEMVLDACGLRSERLREILSAYRGLYFVRAVDAPFSLHAFTLDSFVQGAFTIEGGGNALQKALITQFRSLGGHTWRRARVSQVDVEDGRVRRIRCTDGREADCRWVVAGIDPRVALSLLPEGAVRPVYSKRIKRLRSGVGGLAAYLRVRPELDLSHRRLRNTFWFGPTGSGETLFDASWLASGQPPVFLTASSTRESNWKGPQAVVVLSGLDQSQIPDWHDTKTGERGPAYAAYKAEIGRQLVASALKAWPELDGQILSVEVATPLTHRDYTLNGGGAIYGIHHDIRQSAGRGVGWRTRVKGYLLTGHSVLYPGLIGSMISAFYSCGEILDLPTIMKEVRRA